MPAKNSKLVRSRHQYYCNALRKVKLNQDDISETLHATITRQSMYQRITQCKINPYLDKSDFFKHN